jgi:tetratricopeptide (TPR) repeat protein
MGRQKPVPTPLSEAVQRLKRELDWEEEQIGQTLGVSRKVVHNKLNGWSKLTREEAEAIVEMMGLPPAAALEASLFFGRWIEAAKRPEPPLDPDQENLRRCEVVAGLIGVHVAKAVFPELLQDMRMKRIARDRERAAECGRYLLRLQTNEERQERIREAEDYQSWALVEWLCDASVRAAADKPARAVELAELALFIVPLVPGPDCRRHRLEGYATFFLANALRVRNDLDEADAAVQRGWASWRAGADDDFLPLEEGRLFDLEASLRRAQRRFDEALALLERALEVSSEENKGRILLKKSATYEQKGDIKASIEALRQARPHIEAAGLVRDVFGVRFNLAVNLAHLARFREAAELLPEVRDAAIELGNELDLVRTLWLQARIDAGLGKAQEAVASLEQVFREFVNLALPYDAALAGLNLTVFYFELGREREILSLTLQMEKVFRAKKVEREALAALLVFCEAARREEATVALARQTADIIEKVQVHRAVPPLSPPLERGVEKLSD